MFDFVRNNHRLIQIMLALIAVPFAFWGVDSYVRGTDQTREIANVGGQSINQGEFNQALRDQQEQMRGMLGRAYDADKFDTAESRQVLVNSLIDRRLVAAQAAQGNLTLSDAELRDTILAIQPFQDNGKFSKERYEQGIRGQGMTTPVFESRLRSDLVLRQLTGAIESTTIPSKASLLRWQALNEQEREVYEQVFQPAQFLQEAQVSPEAIKEYYEANKKTFESAPRLSADYLVLSIDKLAEQIRPGDDDIKSWYDGHQAQYLIPEQRQASHVLIAAAKSAPPAEREKARLKADEVLALAKKNPAGFADLAKKNSQDPGSAAKGGDLGMFSRGMMVKPFEDAAYALREGEISAVVESDFGYHIIKLVKINPAGGKTLPEVRSEIERELRKQMAQKKFTEIAEAFSNLVYEQSDSLQPAAERFKLTIQHTTSFSKREAATVAPALNNDKLLIALFADDAVKNKRNTEAIETAANTLVAARVVAFEPAKTKSLGESEPAIALILRTREAGSLARKRAEAAIAELNKGGDAGIQWSAAKIVSRQNPLDLPPQAVTAILRADAAKLPAYATAEIADAAHAVYRIAAVRQPQIADADKRRQRDNALMETFSRNDFESYVAALRGKTKIEISKQNLERKER